MDCRVRPGNDKRGEGGIAAFILVRPARTRSVHPRDRPRRRRAASAELETVETLVRGALKKLLHKPVRYILVKYDKRFINFVFYNQHSNPNYYTPLDLTNNSIDSVKLSIDYCNNELTKIKESSLSTVNKSKSFKDDELEYEEIRNYNRSNNKDTLEK